MDDVSAFFETLAPLVFWAVVIAGVVLLVRRVRGEAGPDSGIGELKRAYYYVLGAAALGVAASGAMLLARGLLEVAAGERVVAGGEAQLALALALTIVGAPFWLYLLSLAQRSVREHPVEAGTLARKLYVYLVLGSSAAIGAGGLVLLLQGLLGFGEFSPGQFALPAVMGGVWWCYWRIEAAEGQPTESARLARRLYLYLTAGYGLALLGAGAAWALADLLTTAYDASVSTLLLSPASTDVWSLGVRGGLSVAAVGGLWWWLHWQRLAGADGPSDVRQVYLYLYTVMGGVITVVAAIGIALYAVLQWAVDAPGVTAASSHFRSLPGVAAGLAVGGGVWGYHAAVIHQEAGALEGGLPAARRVYRYLVAALGLGTLAAGLVLLIGAAVGVLAPEAGGALAGSGWWKGPLSWGLTLALAGAPVWGRHWRAAQQEAGVDPAEERGSQSRRAFIYGVFGIAVLVTLGNLSALLFIVLRDLLEGELGLLVLQDGKWAIGALVMAGVISVYHWLVLREDRAAAGERPGAAAAQPRRKRVTVMASADGPARQIEARLGYGVRRRRRLDGAETPGVSPADLERLADQVAGLPGDSVLVVVDASGLHVLPYE